MHAVKDIICKLCTSLSTLNHAENQHLCATALESPSRQDICKYYRYC